VRLPRIGAREQNCLASVVFARGASVPIVACWTFQAELGREVAAGPLTFGLKARVTKRQRRPESCESYTQHQLSTRAAR